VENEDNGFTLDLLASNAEGRAIRGGFHQVPTVEKVIAILEERLWQSLIG
jgi:hypothetical protein